MLLFEIICDIISDIIVLLINVSLVIMVPFFQKEEEEASEEDASEEEATEEEATEEEATEEEVPEMVLKDPSCSYNQWGEYYNAE